MSYIKEPTLLFLDIETVAMTADYALLPERMKVLWDKKSKKISPESPSPETFAAKAGIFAEFGKIIVIGLGVLGHKEGKQFLRIKSCKSDNEHELLEEFVELITGLESKGPVSLVAHNGKEFDFPYLSRRILVNGIKLPACLNNAGKKPWEVFHQDTLDLWKFGDYKHYTSLELLAAIFDIEGSKDDIDGSMVSEVYYKQNDLQRIARYCEKDVAVLAQLYMKMTSREPLMPQSIEYAS